ncbi:hypothetical protein EBQ74_10465 [bacterium]|nr:hypothetical protein [bacterium]
MKKFLIFFFVLVSPVFGMKEYYSLSRSLRALGMGGAFYGLSNDEYAMFYNPAGLSLYDNSPQAMLNISGQIGSRTLSALKTVKTLSSKSVAESIDALAEYQGDPIYLGAGILPYFLMKHLAVGILLPDLKADYLLSGKEIDSNVDFTAISDAGLIVSYGRSVLNENLHVGMTAKGIARAGGRTSFSLGDIVIGGKLALNPNDLGGTGFGIDFDIGAIYDIPYLPFGESNRVSLVFTNLLATQFSMGSKSTGEPPGLPRMVSLGWHSVVSGGDIVDRIHLLADLAEFQIGGEDDVEIGARSGKFLKHLNVGFEIPIGVLTLRGGLRQGWISGGFGLNFKYAKLDFATYGEELSSGPGRLQSRRFGVTLAMGMGAPNKPFRSLVKGSKVKPGEKEVEFKIAPKPKEEPKIDPALEITPSTEKKKVEEPLSEYQIVTPDPKETGKTPESKPNAKAKKKIKSSDKLEELTD